MSTGRRDLTGVASRIWAPPGRQDGAATPAPGRPPAGAAAPSPARPLPEWITLSEAAFLTGLDREALLEWTRTGSGARGSRLSRRMGPAFVMVRTEDLRASGLLAPAPGAVAPPPAPAAVASTRASAPAFVASAPALVVSAPAPSEPVPPAPPPRAPAARPEPVAVIAAAAPGELAAGRRRRPWRLVRRAVVWTATAAALGLILSVTAPALVGYRSLVVLSGSMSPAIGTGDVVVERPVSPLDLRVGDVVTFQDPDRAGRAVTHRIRDVRVRGAAVDVTTRGDANGTVERWSVASSGRVGRVVYHVWKIGYVLVWLRTPLGRLLFLVLPALGLVALELRRIWRADPAPDVAAT